jgi:hypothetical protein
MAALWSFAVSDFQVGYEKQIYDVENVIGLIDDDGPSAGREGHEFAVLHGNLSAIRQMNDERLEWGRIVQLSDMFDCHAA